MAIKFYEASGGESGTKRQKLGDQTGYEVHVTNARMENWIHLMRYKGDVSDCKKAAAAGGKLANSSLVGYAQDNRMSLYNRLKECNWDVDKFLAEGKPGDTDCSAFAYTVWCCVCPELRIGNNGIQWPPTTADMSAFTNSGKFEKITNASVLKSKSQWRIGDVLTRYQDEHGHAVSVYCTDVDEPDETSTSVKKETNLSNTYNSPYQAQRDKLAKRLPATRCGYITTIMDGNNERVESLFASPFYYLQNGYNERVDIATPVEDRKYVKTLLYLHTLNWNYDKICTESKKAGFFNNNQAKHGGIEMVPSGWIYLLGGLIWREDYAKLHNDQDPIAFGYYEKKSDGTKVYHSLYATTFPGCPLLIKDKTNKNKYTFGVVNSLNVDEYDSTTSMNYSIGNPGSYKYVFRDKEFIAEDMDYSVRNGLKDAFIRFVEGYYHIIESLELSLNVYGQIPQAQPEAGAKVLYAVAESIMSGKAPVKTIPMTYSSCMNLRFCMKNQTLDSMLRILNARTGFLYDSVNVAMVKGFSGHYAMGFHVQGNDGITLYFNEKYKPAEDLFNMTYGAPLFATTNIVSPTKNNTRNQKMISKKNFKSYLAGFCDTLTYYTKNSTNIVATGAKPEDLSPHSPEREFKSGIYMFLKNFWDRWYCGFYNAKKVEKNSYFAVDTFFDNFIFIDTFYNNIGHKLRLNCNHLLAEYKGGDNSENLSGKSLINHLGNVVSKHRCVLFNFADYVDFCGDTAYDNVKDMFRPVPPSYVTHPKISNKFVIIYTHTANLLETNDRNKYIPDTFDIWSYDDATGVAPSVFNYKSTSEVERGSKHPENKMGYKVPAFGVAYSRQDNTYWKNIRVGMDTQAITEQSARSLAQIAEKGNSSKKKICFYGQDIYSIYQAYSYLVTIEMMGCAQIQPLMYFQLMNIPMFRGTYMVIKVEHSIKAGDMTTTFTGMKMSKVQYPFTTNWFTVVGDNNGPEISDNKDKASNGSPIKSVDGFELDIEDNKLSDAINKYVGKEMNCDVFVRNVYKELGVEIKHNLKLENNIGMYQELNSDPEWNMVLFKIRPRKSNNWKPFTNANSHPDVGDVLFGYHNGVVDGDQLHHVAIYLGMHNGRHYVAEGGDNVEFKSKTGIPNTKVQVCSIDTSMMSESDDVYVFRAKSKKANIEQHKEEIKQTTTTGTKIEAGTKTGVAGEVSVNGKIVGIEIKSPVRLYTHNNYGQNYPLPNELTSGSSFGNSFAVSQCSFTNGGDVVGVVVSEGKIVVGRNSPNGSPAGSGTQYGRGGFVMYNNGSWKFFHTKNEYMNALQQDAPSGIKNGSQCNTITCAFQQYFTVSNGQKCNNFLQNKEGRWHFRNLAEKNGRLYFVVGDGVWQLDDWERELVSLGYQNATYMDSAGNWEYGWYKVQPSDKTKIKNNVKDDVWYWKGSGALKNYTGWSNFITF